MVIVELLPQEKITLRNRSVRVHAPASGGRSVDFVEDIRIRVGFQNLLHRALREEVGRVAPDPETLELRHAQQHFPALCLAHAADVQMLQILHAGQGREIQLDVGIGNNLQELQLRAVFQHVQRVPAAGRDDAHLEIRHIPHEIPVVQFQIVPQVQVLQVGEVLQLLGVFIPHVRIEVGAPEPLGIRAHGELVICKPDSPDDLHLRIGVPDLRHTLRRDTAGVHVQALAALHQRKDFPHRCALVRHDAVVQVHLLRQRAQIPPIEDKAVLQLRLGRGLLQGAQVGPGEVPGRFQGSFHGGGLRVQLLAVQFCPGPVGPHVDPRQLRHLAQQLRRLFHILMGQLVERYSRGIQRVNAALREIQFRYRCRGRFRCLGRLGGFRRGFLRGFFCRYRARIRRNRGCAAAAEQGHQQDGQDDGQDDFFHKRFPLFFLISFMSVSQHVAI